MKIAPFLSLMSGMCQHNYMAFVVRWFVALEHKRQLKIMSNPINNPLEWRNLL